MYVENETKSPIGIWNQSVRGALDTELQIIYVKNAPDIVAAINSIIFIISFSSSDQPWPL